MTGDLRKHTSRTIVIKDTNAENDYRINSPAGEYGILSASSGNTTNAITAPIAHGRTTGSAYPTSPGNIGLIFYQAGVVVLDARAFARARDASQDAADFGQGQVTASTNPKLVYHLTGGILNSASCMMHRQVVDAAGGEPAAERNSD